MRKAVRSCKAPAISADRGDGCSVHSDVLDPVRELKERGFEVIKRGLKKRTFECHEDTQGRGGIYDTEVFKETQS